MTPEAKFVFTLLHSLPPPPSLSLSLASALRQGPTSFKIDPLTPKILADKNCPPPKSHLISGSL